jgi:hypothetical protein
VLPVEAAADTDQVYFINLIGGEQKSDIEAIHHLFPRADISNVPQGTSDWHPHIEGSRRDILNTLDTIRETGRTKPAEKSTVGIEAGVGPFEIFLFPTTRPEKSASVLVAGEVDGLPFSFFLGNPIFKRTFREDQVKELEPMSCHLLSVGAWRAFYSVAESKTSLPVEPAHKGAKA